MRGTQIGALVDEIGPPPPVEGFGGRDRLGDVRREPAQKGRGRRRAVEIEPGAHGAAEVLQQRGQREIGVALGQSPARRARQSPCLLEDRPVGGRARRAVGRSGREDGGEIERRG